MTELTASTPSLGWHPSDFALEGTDGRRYGSPTYTEPRALS
jgi:hypothetical protein